MDVALDSEGFLVDRDEWSEEIAREMAISDGYEMTDEIMGFVVAARDMFEEDAVVPPIRKFAKKMGVDSKHLYNVFKKGPMKMICKWGGLPKPTGCV